MISYTDIQKVKLFGSHTHKVVNFMVAIGARSTVNRSINFYYVYWYYRFFFNDQFHTKEYRGIVDHYMSLRSFLYYEGPSISSNPLSYSNAINNIDFALRFGLILFYKHKNQGKIIHYFIIKPKWNQHHNFNFSAKKKMEWKISHIVLRWWKTQS